MNSESNDTEVIWNLFRTHVPEIASGVVRVLGIAREPGKRSVLAVSSNDPRIDPVGTCVGPRGSRVKCIVQELGGEKIDLVRWEDSAERFISNLLGPARLASASFNDATREATVTVIQSPSSRMPELALRSRLLMDLTGWKLHVEVNNES